jgi:hypothetical protein
METEPIIVNCTCGAIIPHEEIEYHNKSNEEGEDFFEVTADCPSCKFGVETSGWGELENKIEAAEYLKDYFESFKKF